MNQHTIGVDISKAHLDVHRLADGARARFGNEVGGYTSLIEWIGEGPWVRERNAKEVFLAIVSAVVLRDRRRGSPEKLPSMAPDHLFSVTGPRRYPVPGVEGLWLLTGISNENKVATLKRIIAAADPGPSAGSIWNGSSKIEWWLPTRSSNTDDPGGA